MTVRRTIHVENLNQIFVFNAYGGMDKPSFMGVGVMRGGASGRDVLFVFGEVGDSSSASKEIGDGFSGREINAILVESILSLFEFGCGERMFLYA